MAKLYPPSEEDSAVSYIYPEEAAETLAARRSLEIKERLETQRGREIERYAACKWMLKNHGILCARVLNFMATVSEPHGRRTQVKTALQDILFLLEYERAQYGYSRHGAYSKNIADTVENWTGQSTMALKELANAAAAEVSLKENMAREAARVVVSDSADKLSDEVMDTLLDISLTQQTGAADGLHAVW